MSLEQPVAGETFYVVSKDKMLPDKNHLGLTAAKTLWPTGKTLYGDHCNLTVTFSHKDAIQNDKLMMYWRVEFTEELGRTSARIPISWLTDKPPTPCTFNQERAIASRFKIESP